MTYDTPRLRSDADLLYAAELLHRIGNNYTRIILFASIMASNATSGEAKSALRAVIDCLQADAETHRVLRPPTDDSLVDFSDAVARLCQAMAAAFQSAGRELDLRLELNDPIMLQSWRSWHACLIVAELITNACRHACSFTPVKVLVSINACDQQVYCRVVNDGSAYASARRGLGTQLIDSLAEKLDGFVERRFNRFGAAVTICFPYHDAGVFPFDFANCRPSIA